jgi:hypothetical protein
MNLPNWTDMSLYHYLAIGGGAFILLALLLFFTRLSQLKIPAIFLGIVGGFGAGAGLGVVCMGFLGYHWQPQVAEGDPREAIARNAPPGMPGGMMGGGGMPPGMMGGMMGGRGPNPKNQLASLVAKLDLLTHKPLSVKLDDKQKHKVLEQIKDLDAEKELSEEKAKERVTALLEILKDQRQTLEDAGYRWPGQDGGPQRPTNAPNPFKEEQNGQHLKALRELLTEVQTE